MPSFLPSVPRPPSWLVPAFAFVLVASCDSGPEYSANPAEVVGGSRPATVLRPADYDPDIAYPLVVLLHGYGASGLVQDAYFGTSLRIDSRRFLLVAPDGTRDSTDMRYWNAGPCCTFGSSPPDDVAYLVGLVEEIARTHHVDRSRVYVIGHSNGGAMAMKLACAAPEHFVAIASLAGTAPEHEADCPASDDAVSVLAMHGDADSVIHYDGTTVPVAPPLAPYPSAPEAARRFATRLGCDTTTTTPAPAIDFASDPAGSETTPARYETGCAPGTSVELWTIAGGGHFPALAPDATDHILDWLFAHPR